MYIRLGGVRNPLCWATGSSCIHALCHFDAVPSQWSQQSKAKQSKAKQSKAKQSQWTARMDMLAACHTISHTRVDQYHTSHTRVNQYHTSGSWYQGPIVHKVFRVHQVPIRFHYCCKKKLQYPKKFTHLRFLLFKQGIQTEFRE